MVHSGTVHETFDPLAPDPTPVAAARVPVAVVVAAALASVIALYDVADALVGKLVLGGEGRVLGTLVRDGFLLAGAGMCYRRASRGRTILVAFLALTLVRVAFPTSVPDLLVNALAIPALAALFHPTTRAWLAPPARRPSLDDPSVRAFR